MSVSTVKRPKAVVSLLVVAMLLSVPMLFLIPTNVYANGVANDLKTALNGGSATGFDGIKSFFETLLTNVVDLIPIVGTLALALGVVICFTTSPLKKYRGVGYGCIASAVAAYALWLFMPAILGMLQSN